MTKAELVGKLNGIAELPEVRTPDRGKVPQVTMDCNFFKRYPEDNQTITQNWNNDPSGIDLETSTSRFKEDSESTPAKTRISDSCTKQF